ncbi:MAG: AAA family ATPase [Clostridium sp.]|uniref:AAA family ATPase n=1 Tax=Clostridium sp. TaxID=1506 RepID=UPI002FC95128
MKPLKLKLNAFGPYKGEEEIDFTKLDSIYLVTGPTGAGKTSIFDAICFALYGKTSGKSREQKDLKSDFADLDKVTYVDLEFSINSDIYRVIREPQQVMKGRKTLRGHSVELHMPGDKIITRKQDVEDKIEEMLGLNVEQFRQIVMLPQGEFRKLIESSTEDKETIFRKIFSSRIYKDFQDRLKDKSFAVKKIIEKSIESRGALIGKINPGDNEKLSELINSENYNIIEIIDECDALLSKDKSELKKVEKSLSTTEKEIEKVNTDIQLATEKNTKIQSYNDLRERLVTLKSEDENITSIEKVIDAGVKASNISVYEKEYIKAKTLLALKEKELLKAESDFEISTREVEEARNMLLTITGLNEQVKDESKSLHKAEGKLQEYSRYEEYKVKYAQSKKELESVEKKLQQEEESIKSLNKSIDDINNVIDKNSDIEGKILTKEQSLKILEDTIVEVRDLYTKANRFKEDIHSHISLSRDYEREYKIYTALKKNKEDEEEIFKRQQAGILALGLREGEMCPVCGSTNHPYIASLSEGSLKEDDIKKLLKKVEDKKSEIDSVMAKIVALNASIEKSEEDIIIPLTKKYLSDYDYERSNIEDILISLKSKGVALKTNIEEIKAEIENLKLLKEEIFNKKTLKKNIEKDIEEKVASLKILEGSRLNLFGEVEAALSVTSQFEASYKDEMITREYIENTILDINSKIEVLNNRINLINEKDKTASMNLSSSKKNLENKRIELNDAKIALGSREEEFISKINLYFESEEDYRNSLIEEDKISKLKDRVKLYREEVIGVNAKIEELEKVLNDYELVNIAILEECKNNLTAKKDTINSIIKTLYSRVESNSSILKTIKKITSEMYEVEKEYSIISELSSIANGNNSKRITFERYVLLYHFNEILEAANIRFKIMTNDRYYLKHKTSIGDRRTSQGLDFDVYDNYTGKIRSIGSLSGGESFKASLALALGLSDVIQSHAGGVRIDTMFIDEGFGTLDSESLEKAIETLLELGENGRIVGIISHVNELKERIPSKIEVTRDTQGSYIKEVVS